MAQDVERFFGDISERLRARDYLRLSGNAAGRLGLNYFADGGSGARARNAPLVWNASASLNADLLGVQLPFSVAVSSRNTLYNLPSYRFVGASPTYKWVTLHGGDRSMTFSPYSLSGTSFRGGGLELRPGKFYLGAFRGRLRRARIQDAGAIQSGLETGYRRIAQGVKFGFDNGGGSSALVSVFHSTDRRPGTEAPADSSALRPEENMVLTFSGGHRFSPLVALSAEYAQSALTRDLAAPRLSDPGGALNLFGLFAARTTTASANAYNGTLTLSPAFGQIDLRYERIAPGYRSHGSLFFQNDLENITTGLRTTLLEGKLSLNTSVGVQRNDLRNDQVTNLRRFIGSLNLSYDFSERTTSTLGLSNFTSTNRFRTLSVDNLLADSIVLAQTQFGLDASTTVVLDEARSRVLLLNGSWQRADLIRNERVDTSQASAFGLLMVAYSYQPREARGALSASLLLHRNRTPLLTITTLGPNANYRYRVGQAERLTLSATAGYNFVFSDFADPNVAGGGTGLLRASVGGALKLTDKQTIDLTATLITAGDSATRPGYSDGQLNLQYGLSF